MRKLLLLVIIAAVALSGCATSGFLGFLATTQYVDLKAKAIQDRLLARAQTQYIPPVALAITYLHTDTGAVFTYLEKACEIREPLLRYALWHTLQLQSLRSDSRFQELRRRVGL